MKSEIEFYDRFYNLTLLNRLKFFLMVWNKGSTKSDLEKTLHLNTNESIESFSDTLNKNGFLTIDASNSDPYYFISETNFKNIFNHICDSSHIPKDEKMYELVRNNRKEINPDLIKKLPYELSNNKLFEEKNLTLLLEKNIAFLFIFIMGFKEELRKDKQFNDFYINSILAILKYQTSIYSSNPDEKDEDYNLKREFLRESMRVQLSWRM